MPTLSNNERLQQVASALEELNAEVVYVGGAVIQLYSSDAAALNPMTTYDVDCVVDVVSYKDYRNFEKKLFEKHFQNDMSEGAPICRYLFNGEKVDFMPKVDTGIGESNRWYLKGLEHRQPLQLENGYTIFIMPVTYYLASKIEALHSRGGTDYRGEKDFEDIVFVLNSCGHVMENMNKTSDLEVSVFLNNSFEEMLDRPNIREEIECALLEEGRLDVVLNRMHELADYK